MFPDYTIRAYIFFISYYPNLYDIFKFDEVYYFFGQIEKISSSGKDIFYIT